jgi:hypothetical protein
VVFGRRRKPARRGASGEELGEPRSLFAVEEVFEIGHWGLGVSGLLVLAGRVHRGELHAGDLLRLPDGQLLRVKAIEAQRRRVKRVGPGVPVGVAVECVGWRPRKRDLLNLRIGARIRELRESVLEKYRGRMPREAAERLAESEVRQRLENLINEASLTIYKPPGPAG